MRPTLDGTAERAADHARTAAARAGVEVVPLTDVGPLQAASLLFADVWGTGPGTDQISPDLMRALTHAGNYAAGAYAEGNLVGAIVGFLGRDNGNRGDEGVYLHSHILGVSAARRGSNVGFALKQDQRAWALGRGLSRVTWTFDPLVARNAYFNVQKLGAEPVAYYERFYGSMADSVNAGDESDRLFVVWRLDGPRPSAAAAQVFDEPDADRLMASGATVALSESADGEPVVGTVKGATLLCRTPRDVVALRSKDPGLALRWRRALRGTLGAALNDGYAVTAFTRSGSYVLVRDDGT